MNHNFCTKYFPILIPNCYFSSATQSLDSSNLELNKMLRHCHRHMSPKCVYTPSLQCCQLKICTIVRAQSSILEHLYYLVVFCASVLRQVGMFGKKKKSVTQRYVFIRIVIVEAKNVNDYLWAIISHRDSIYGLFEWLRKQQ